MRTSERRSLTCLFVLGVLCKIRRTEIAFPPPVGPRPSPLPPPSPLTDWLLFDPEVHRRF